MKFKLKRRKPELMFSELEVGQVFRMYDCPNEGLFMRFDACNGYNSDDKPEYRKAGLSLKDGIVSYISDISLVWIVSGYFVEELK